MPVQIVVGTQWGDEGKGKIVDLLAGEAAIVARCQGGPNAGHTVVVGGEVFILHLIPSGALRPGTRCMIGSGVVLDPAVLFDEIDMLARHGLDATGRLVVDARAHVILPTHALEERADESRRGAARIGTTMRGIGPAYEAKAGRRGVRVIDLLDADRLRPRVGQALAHLRMVARSADADPGELPEEDALMELGLRAGARLRDSVGDVALLLHEALGRGEHVLVECAQGTFLDLDQGSYPYVTSSNATAGGACTGLGIGPRTVRRVLGVTKAYATRVGMGPFPGELDEPQAARLREAGAEYGATTGRPRRCGWLDVVALRRAVALNGIDALAVTKLDVLDGWEYVKVVSAYEADPRGEWYPSVCPEAARPVERQLAGWEGSTRGARTLADLPAAARRYLEFIADAVGVPVALVSVGSGREETVTVEPSPPVGALS